LYSIAFASHILHIRIAATLKGDCQTCARSSGFFLKGGAGMALVRDWVDVLGEGGINSKALSIVIGGGWVVRPTSRAGFEVFASQHAAALGDIQRADGLVPDVIGNFWSLGAAIVIR
jgi:hypothetical protein